MLICTIYFVHLCENVLFQTESCRLWDSAKACIKAYFTHCAHRQLDMSIAILLTVKNSTVQDPTIRTQIHDMQKYLHPGLQTRKCSNGLCCDGEWKNSLALQHRHCSSQKPKVTDFSRCFIITTKPASLG